MTDLQATAAVILAAGKGTRMKSKKHKVLHEIAGKPMLFHLMDTVQSIGCDKQVLVVGAERDQLEKAATIYGDNVSFATQEEQLGTGHAALSAEPILRDHRGDVMVLFGDTPFISKETMQRMLAARQVTEKPAPAIVVLGFDAADPGKYGRLILSDNGLERIVEYKDASPEERAVTLCNSGVMIVDGSKLFTWLGALSNSNASGEYYLTDLIEIARCAGETAVVVQAAEAEVMGINSRSDLAQGEAVYQVRKRQEMMANGVTLIDPSSVFFAADTIVASDVIIEPNVFFGKGVKVESGVTIKAFSHIDGAYIHEGASVGPYARLRPGAEIGPDAKIGNFVEVKKAEIQKGAKVSHLSYIGDATIGEAANIGAGTITCNYDGFFKYKTDIGVGAFIGSNTALVAPVSVGAGAMVGAGSTITGDVDKDALSLTRAKQRSVDGFAARFRTKRKAEKGEA